MPRLAANISTLFTAVPLLERFAAAANAGFTAVEIQFPYDHNPADLAAAAQAAGVQIALINLPAGNFAAGERGIACIPGREAEFSHGVAQAITYATALNCTRINCLAGLIPAGETHETCRALLARNLRSAADAFAAHNITLLIEPLNRADNPHFSLDGTQDALTFIAELGHHNISLQFDLYHSAAAGEDPYAVLAKSISRIGHIQLSDFPGRGAPGSGTLDFTRFFQMLSNYTGWTACEYFDPAPDFAWMQNYALSP